jgi:uncharacterized protein (TIGR03437 family)
MGNVCPKEWSNLLMARLTLLPLFVLLPAVVVAESLTPSIGYTGAPADHSGANCSTCHNTYGPANSATSGSLTVTVGNGGGGYVPSVAQLIRIVVQNPSASKWGFQITIRSEDEESVSAGTFAIPTTTLPEQVVCDDGTQYGSPAPCGGSILRQFAEHYKAPMGDMGAAYEFDVDWTPPPQELGRLHVYVAAVAANGDGTPYGDYVYTNVQTLSNQGTCNLTGTPVFQSLVNGASFQPGFSSGAMVTIFGSGFETSGFTRTAGPGDYVNGAYPNELGCVGVEVTGPGIEQPVQIPIAYVSEGQINAQMPELTGTGAVMVTVVLNPGSPSGVNAAPATLQTLQAFAPAFFTFQNSSSIAAEDAHTYAIIADPSVVAGGVAAQPGEVISLYGTGFGAVTPSVPVGTLATGAAKLAGSITVSIGGVAVPAQDIQYAGLSPGSISGLYQFNVVIPAGVPSGDEPVVISIGGVETQAGATLPIQ